MTTDTVKPTTFSRYQVFMIAMIALLQFTVVLDFMVMAPLGAILIRVLHITPSKFGVVVSAYAFSAGISGILAAGFADKFDRKKMLLVFYTGFVLGTLLCGIAPDYYFLLIARMVTGFFGGVLIATNMAILADTFPPDMRGRVMGYVQMAFAVSQVAGIPLGLYLANQFGWHMPFLMIVGFCLVIGIAIVRYMKPVTAHLQQRAIQQPFQHLLKTASQKRYLWAFLTTIFLSTGGFMMMPFSSAFMVHNVGISEHILPIVFIVAGIGGLVTGPLIGKWSDKIGKYKMFIGGSILAGIMVIVITHLTIIPLWQLLILNTLMYIAVFSRFIPSQALISIVPDMKDRGAFMSINSSIQQMGGGVASVIGGWIISQDSAGHLLHYDTIGYVTICAFIICGIFMYYVNNHLNTRGAAAVPSGTHAAVKSEPVPVLE